MRQVCVCVCVSQLSLGPHFSLQSRGVFLSGPFVSGRSLSDAFSCRRTRQLLKHNVHVARCTCIPVFVRAITSQRVKIRPNQRRLGFPCGAEVLLIAAVLQIWTSNQLPPLPARSRGPVDRRGSVHVSVWGRGPRQLTQHTTT